METKQETFTIHPHRKPKLQHEAHHAQTRPGQPVKPTPEHAGGGTQKNGPNPITKRFGSRANGITVISGQQGTGKSHHLKEKIRRYITDDTVTGKAGGKVLIYDTNDEFQEFPVLGWDQLHMQPDKTAYRVIGGYYDKKTGKVKSFSIDELRDGFMYLLENFGQGMLVLDDFNRYSTNTRKQNVVGTLVTARHRQMDIVIVVQDLGMVTQELWRNAAYYTFHKQMTSVEKSKDKMTHYDLMKIAEKCVNEQFMSAQRLYNAGQISDEERKVHQSYFVHVDFRNNKITGASKERFMRASRAFRKENMAEIKKRCLQMGLKSNVPEHQDKAVEAMVYEDLMMWGGA